MKNLNMSDSELLKELKNSSKLLKELKDRYKDSLLYDLQVNILLETIGRDKVKQWLQEIKD